MKFTSLLLPLFVCSALLAPAAHGQIENEDRDHNPVVATINGKRQIRLRELDQTTRGEVQKYEQQIHRIRQQALDLLIDKILLEEEAAARTIDLPALIQSLLPGAVALSPARLEKAYADYLPALRHLGEVEAQLRVRLDLESHERIARFREALGELRRRARIETRLPQPAAAPVRTTLSGPALGGPSARVQLVVFSDYQCPSCREVSGWLPRLARQYPSELRILHKHFPLNIHAQAFLAARAACCAAEQGRFWDYHARLFAAQDLSEQMLLKYAAELKLDELDFESCLESDASRDSVQEDLDEARALNLIGTPTFIINGRILFGVRSFEQLQSTIEKEYREATRRGDDR